MGFGCVAQLVFAFVALTVSRPTYRVREWTWAFAIPTGVAALLVSIMVFGGPLGAAGGVLSIVAGIAAFAEPRPESRAAPLSAWEPLPPPRH